MKYANNLYFKVLIMDEFQVWEELSNIPADPPKKRQLCDKCRYVQGLIYIS